DAPFRGAVQSPARVAVLAKLTLDCAARASPLRSPRLPLLPICVTFRYRPGGAAMIRILGSRKLLCDGLSRRDFLQVGALGGLGLAALPHARSAPHGALPGFGKAKSVILLFLYGGVSQLETFDPKPDAPLEIRGRLGSLPSSIPGCRVCEGLPRVARVLDRSTVIRSMTHPYPIHGTAFSVTSTPTLDTPMQDNPRDPRHWPFIGSVIDYLENTHRPNTRPPLPRNIALPFLHSSRRRHIIHNAGPYGAFLGRAYD